VANPGFDRIPLPTIGRLLTPQDSSVKSNGRASRYCLFNTVVYTCGCRSPSGNIVLTKLTRSIKVWTEVSPTLHSSLRPSTFPAFRKACVAKLSIDIALCSLSAGCQVAKVSLRGSRRGTLLELSRAPAFMSVEGGDVTKLVTPIYSPSFPYSFSKFIRT
jgi:hypothetical protein